jgi:hypothetical protein
VEIGHVRLFPRAPLFLILVGCYFLPSFLLRLETNTIMASEGPARTLYAPPSKKFNSISDIWGSLVELSNQGDPVAKELIVGWQSLRNQSQTIVNQLCVKE